MRGPDFIEIVKELGINRSEVDYSSSILLRKIIEADKPKLIELFERRAFDEENVRLLFEKQYFDIFEEYPNLIFDNSNNYKLFLDNISNYDVSSALINDIFYRCNNKKELIEALHNGNRVDLFFYILRKNTNKIDYDLFKIFEDKIKDVIEYIRVFNLENYYPTFDVFKLLFLNGYYEIFDILRYYSYENYANLILEDKEMYEQLCKYIEELNDKEFFEVFIRRFNKSQKLLEFLIDKGKFDISFEFEPSVWTIDLQMKVLNILKSNVRDYKDVYQFNNKVPLYNYYKNYNFDNYYKRVTSYYDIYDLKNLDDMNRINKIVTDYKTGIVNLPFKNKILFEFLSEMDSVNIARLTKILLNNSFDNIDKLIDDNGNFTEFYKQFLLFDYDYIIHNQDSVKQEYNNPNYKTYIDFMLKSKEAARGFTALFINMNNLDMYFENETLSRKALEEIFSSNDGILSIIKLEELDIKLNLNELEKEIISKYKTITDKEQKKFFVDYCSRKDIKITKEEVNSILDLIERINNSNSFELRKKANQIIENLSKRDNYLEIFDQVEYIFTSGCAPEFMKRFAMFRLLYPTEIKKDYSVNSPILKSVSQEEALKIIFDDLLKVSLANNSIDIIHYLDILENGENLYRRLDISKYFNNDIQLSQEEKALLREYRVRLEFLADYILDSKYEKDEDDYKTIYNIERELYNRKFSSESAKLIPKGNHFLFINDMIFQKLSSHFTSMITLRMYIGKHSILKTAFEEGRNLRNESLILKKGDFLKGIDSDYLDNIINYGSLSVEFLGEDSNRDVTHLDTDTSILPRDFSNIPELLSSNLMASGWGDMKLIISKDLMSYDDTIITKDDNGLREFSEKDYYKYEIFCINNTHYCFRTAFPATFVKGIIATERNYDRARFIVSKNSFYIPIYDSNGKLIYSYDDYYEDRENLSGLSYYGEKDYDISSNLSFEELQDVMFDSSKNAEDINYKRNAIYNQLSGVFSKYFKVVNPNLTSSVEKGSIEFIDTGSTGRGTNVMHDVDFDFIGRVDHEFKMSGKLNELARDIYKAFNVTPSDSKVIRIENATLPGIKEPLKIEITFLDKNSKIEYTTDMCINDRLSNIKEQYPEEYDKVIANIIYAKNFFKKLKRYKTFEGGFGGVGVENFILQNGGSFYDAAIRFIDAAADSKNLAMFKRKFHIYDFGKNHFAFSKDNYKTVDFPYDNYTYALTDASYAEITNALREFVREKEAEFSAKQQL